MSSCSFSTDRNDNLTFLSKTFCLKSCNKALSSSVPSIWSILFSAPSKFCCMICFFIIAKHCSKS